jgi:hypothetical protein
MTAQYDLDRALGAWFGAEAVPAPPAEPLTRVLETTRRRRPRPSVVASIGSHWVDGWQLKLIPDETTNLRPALVVALVALLVLATAGAALLVGQWLRAPVPPRIPHVYVNELVQSPDLPAPKALPMLVPLIDGRVLAIGDGGDGGDQTTTGVVYDARGDGPMEACGRTRRGRPRLGCCGVDSS